MRIYLYTFPANYEDQIALGKTPMLKIGQTTQDCAETRVLQQMGTATAQHHELKGEFEVEFTDKQFHKFLGERGIEQPDGAGTEWFYITVEQAIDLLHEFAALHSGIAKPIRANLQLREYQQKFVDQFKSTDGDFLLFAKCRSGKSVMGLMAAQASDFKSVLVVSLRTSAGNSWLKDPSTFTAFHEWDAIDLGDADFVSQIKKSQAAGRRVLMVSTVQKLDDKFKHLAKIKKLYPQGVEAIYFDECHIGGFANTMKSLRASIAHGRCLEISGTAFRAAYTYDKQHTFVWDYTKEQAAGLGMPRMKLVTVKYNAGELQEVYGDDPDRLNNIWTVIDGKWQDEASVRNFFARYFTYGRVHKKRQLFRNSEHILVHLPSVAACQLAVETINSMSLPWSPLDVTSASGNCQQTILDHVESHTKTICFTVWANVVGVTVKKWDTVVFASKTESAENWIQFAFRGGSTDEDSWTVIDFAPEQALSSIIDMVQVASDANEMSQPSNAIKRFLEFADIQEFDDGFTDIDYDGLLKLTCEQPEKAVELLSRQAAMLGKCGEYSDDLAKGFGKALGVSRVVVVAGVLNSNGTNNDGNTKVEGRKEVSPNELRALLKKIKGALFTVPSLVAVHAVDESITSVFQLLASPYLKPITGVDRTAFETAIATGWISERELSALVAKSALIIDAV